MPLFKYIFC